MSEREPLAEVAAERLSAGSMSRRAALRLAVGTVAATVTGERWVFAQGAQGHIVKIAVPGGAETWTPVLFGEREAEGLARLCEAILPRTDTPGARDARVHEYIDLSASLEAEPAPTQVLEGFRWLDARCRKLHGGDLAAVSESAVIALLSEISDERKADELPPELATGARFFADLKRRTLFGYYTSREGWVDELGQPDAVTMERFRGCLHPPGSHTHDP
jgi:hypothetical protein